ncbi:hypothetical protein JZU69_06135, partial [bacterium]|nr:hypothetical protein [bacterium]
GLTLYADVAAMAFAAPAIGELEGAAAGAAAAGSAYDWAMAGEHLFSQLVASHFYGRACLENGDWGRAAKLLQDSVDLAESIRCKIYLPLSMAGLGLARAHLGAVAAGGDLIAAGRGYAERLGVRRHRAKIGIFSARAHLIAGAAAAALVDARTAAELARADRQEGDLAAALLVAAQAGAALGDAGAATADIKRAVALCDEIGAVSTKAAALTLRRSLQS